MKYTRFNKKAFMVLPLALSIMLTAVGAAEGRGERDGKSLSKSTVSSNVRFDGNRIWDDAENNGMIVSHRITGHSGMEWPGGSGKFSNFASGVWIGGKINGGIRVSAGEYAGEFVGGPFGSTGDEPEHRMFKVTKATIAGVIDGSIDVTTVTDIMEWPTDLGAPWVDADDNGGAYNPTAGDYPDILGDQFIWYVINDGVDSEHSVFATSSLGLEAQVSIWGFDSPLALGDMMFVKYLMINKGASDVTETYMTLWDDPDLGNAGDDFVACDTVLSLGYCYNDGPDAQYGAGGGAIGYDFFQGPIVASVGDTARALGRDIPGFKNLKMSSFVKFINSADPLWNDPGDEIEAYNLMRGVHKDGTDFVNSETNEVVKFMYPDHPRDGQGPGNAWADSDDHPASDRRMMLNVGPFTLAVGDTQEVVFGILHALASDPFGSIDLLKVNDALAQFAYDSNFQLPDLPPAPNVTISALDEELIIQWEGNAESYSVEGPDTPGGDATSYDFEGYNVWQFENATGSNPRIIGTFDLTNGITRIKDQVFDADLGEVIERTTHYGSDSGLKRFFNVRTDASTGLPLINNRTYYFAVTAYGYDEYGLPKVLENSAVIQAIRPSKLTTLRGLSDAGTSIVVEHTSGGSDGSVVIEVVDPGAISPDTYKVSFSALDAWNVTNSAGDTLVNGYANLSGDEDYPIVDGFIVKTAGPDFVINTWGWADGDVSPLFPTYDRGRWISGVNFGGAALFGGLGMAGVFWGAPPGVNPAEAPIVELRFTHMTAYSDTNGNGSFDSGEPYSFDTAEGQKAFMYQTWGAGNYRGFFDVPFQAWDVTDAANPKQLNIFIRDRDDNGAWDITPSSEGGAPFNYTWIMDSEYDPTGALYDPATGTDLGAELVSGAGAIPAWYTMWAQYRGDRQFLAMDGVLTITPNFVNTVDDVFTFSTESAAGTVVAYDPEQISVYPNPYFAFNPEETNPGAKIITFTHLPETATIRVFSLSGDQVTKIDHTSGSIESWNATNAFNVPIASGMYIVHISTENGDVIRKLGVVQAEERLNVF